MQRKLTITVDEAVYDGLHRIIGRGRISGFIEGVVKPYVSDEALDAGYRAMAADLQREKDATEWCEALAGDAADEAR